MFLGERSCENNIKTLNVCIGSVVSLGGVEPVSVPPEAGSKSSIYRQELLFVADPTRVSATPRRARTRRNTAAAESKHKLNLFLGAEVGARMRSMISKLLK